MKKTILFLTLTALIGAYSCTNNGHTNNTGNSNNNANNYDSSQHSQQNIPAGERDTSTSRTK